MRRRSKVLVRDLARAQNHVNGLVCSSVVGDFRWWARVGNKRTADNMILRVCMGRLVHDRIAEEIAPNPSGGSEHSTVRKTIEIGNSVPGVLDPDHKD